MEKDKTNLPSTVENAITEKKRGWVRNPQENFGQENIQPGDNAKYIRHALIGIDLPPISLDSDEQVQERIIWYFNHCADNDMKPTVTGLANSLGIDRRTLSDWGRGYRRGKKDNRTEIVRRAYNILEELWEDYMLNGKINPVSGIFIGKNHFDYADKSEVVIRPESPLGEMEDAATIQNKYIESVADDDEEDD